MTKREKGLVAVLGTLLGLGGLGFAAATLVILPYFEKTKQIRQRQADVDNLELEIATIIAAKNKYEASRQQSLPADVGVSRREYGLLLESLCRRADFLPGTYSIAPAEPDNKSSPTIAPKKPAYTRLTFEMTVKSDLYNLIEFLNGFYQQPLLHAIKKINVQRPSDARAVERKQLDVTMTVEALVLDNAPTRPTLLPVSREQALLASPAAITGHHLVSAAAGKTPPLPFPPGVASTDDRTYLAIAGKNVFFGPAKEPKKEVVDDRPDEDISPFITLTSLVGDDEGYVTAVFRDKLNNSEYTAMQSPAGNILVRGEYELNGKKRLLTASGYSSERPTANIMYGSEEGGNRRVWRVRRVGVGGVVLEKVDVPAPLEKPKPPALGAVAGGFGLFVHLPEGKMYKATIGQSLDAPTKYLLTKDAWKDVYGVPPSVPVTSK